MAGGVSPYYRPSWKLTDTVAVTITSRGDDSQSAAATLTTTANAAYGVIVRPVTDARSGDPGEAVTYTLRVTNTGNVTVYNIDVTDTVGGVTITGTTIASLAPGAYDDTSFTGTYTITQTDIDAGKKDNTASADGEDPDGDPVSDTDDETVSLPQNAAIDIEKHTNGEDADVQQAPVFRSVIQLTGSMW